MSANQPTAAWAGPGDPLVVVAGHLVSPRDGFGEIGRMANGNLRRPSRIEVAGPILGLSFSQITRFGSRANFAARRANGSEVNPTAITNGQGIGALAIIGFDGTAFGDAASVEGRAAENWAVGAHGTSLRFSTVPIGSVALTSQWEMQAAGHFVAVSDNVLDIGASGANRPRDMFLSRDLTMGGSALIGTATAATGSPRLDVVGGIATVISDVTTDATQKVAHFGCRHFTNAEEAVGLIVCLAGATNNTIRFGSGSGSFNAATVIEYYTAADTTTVTGTLAADLTGVGAASLFHMRGNLRIGALSGTNVSVGVNDSGGAGFKLLRVPN